MKKRIFALITALIMLFPLIAMAEETENDTTEIILANTENAYACSPGMRYIDINPIINDDYQKALVYSEPEKTPAYAIFKSTKPFRSFGVEIYQNRWARVNMKFYVSKDGDNWEFASIQLYDLEKTAHKDVWEATQQYHRAFNGSHLGGEYQYLKLVQEEYASANCNIVKIHFSQEEVYGLGGTERVAHSQKPDFDYSTIPSMKEVFKDQFMMGTSAEPWDLDQYGDLITSQFNVLTPENQFKGHVVHNGPDSWYFTAVDNMCEWAKEHGMKVRGHALWYNNNHYWSFFKDENGNPVSKEVALARLEDHVKTLVTRYKGKIQYYDVINEVFDPGTGTLKTYMEEAQICGQDYIPLLFKWAKEADPDAILILDDNGHLKKPQRTGICKQVKEWLAEGVPIDGIGLQWHENIFVSEEDMRDLFRMLRELGLPVYITELDLSCYRESDVWTSYKWEDRDKVSDAAARMYATMFDIFRENADIIECVSFWNTTDNRSTVTNGWRYDFPEPFGMNGEPTKNFWAAIDTEKKLPRWDDSIRDWKELERKTPDGYEELIVPVYKGTPKIDGVIDDVWNKAEKMPVNKYALGENGAEGTARVLWDEDHIYVLGEVTDSTPDVSAPEAWLRDCMELYLSQGNMHVGWLGHGDAQYRVDYTGTLQRLTNAVCVKTEKGYLYEVAIDTDVQKPEPGMIYSFEAGFTDAENGNRKAITKWCDPTNNSYQATIFWGDILISDGTTPIPDKYRKNTNNTKPEEKDESEDGATKLYFRDNQAGIPVSMQDHIAMIRMKDFLELTGAEVRTDAYGNIELKCGENQLKMQMNQTGAYLNGTAFVLNAAPSVISKHVRLPVRSLFEAMGYSVQWNSETSEIRIE